jgi:hypothetical protein
MGSLSDYAENELLDHLFNAAYSPAATIYLALCTADPTDAGTGAAMNEVADAGNYARTAITFGAAAVRRITQNADVDFPQANAAWGTITHWSILDGGTHGAGNMLAHGAFGSSFAPVSGNTPTVASAEIYVEIQDTESVNETGISDYAVHKLLDLMFRNQAYASPADSTYVLLLAAVVDNNDATRADLTEVTGAGYSDELVMSNGSSLTPTWDLAVGGVVDNTHAIVFGPPTGTWDAVVAMAIVDGDSLGNVLVYDNNNIVDQTPVSGDTVQFAAGALDITLT